MDLSQIGESLVGKKVEGTVEGVKVRGTVTKVSEDEYGSTVLIQTDKPTRFFEADDDYDTGGGYKSYNKIALTKGEMRDFQLVSDSNKKYNTMRRIKDGYDRQGYYYILSPVYKQGRGNDIKEYYDNLDECKREGEKAAINLYKSEEKGYGGIVYVQGQVHVAEGGEHDWDTETLIECIDVCRDEYGDGHLEVGDMYSGKMRPVSDSCKVKDSEYNGVNAQVFIAFNDGEEENGCEMCEKHNYERGDVEGHHYEIETEFDCMDGIAVANIWFDVDENTEVSTTGSNAYSETIDNMLWKMFENWGIRQIVADFQYDIDADSNEWIGDSRVKDEYTEPFWYSFGGAFNDPYNIDREVEDEDYDTACYLMDKTDEIKDKYLPNDKAYNSDVEGWVNAFHEITKLLERTPMENPESVYEYLESDNYHDVIGLMWLTGKCGKKRQQQEIDFIKRRNNGGYRPCWYEAEDIIAEELGLI